MKKIKSCKGITLISLVVTVIILLILSGVIINRVNITNNSSLLNKMNADVKLLEEKILVYYNKYQTVPKEGEELNLTISEIPKGEGQKYYKIDASKLNNVTLNYGKNESENDYYIVNDTTLKVYYLKGIINGAKTYYTYK